MKVTLTNRTIVTGKQAKSSRKGKTKHNHDPPSISKNEVWSRFTPTAHKTLINLKETLKQQGGSPARTWRLPGL